jgi:hypothetical protein
MKTTIFCGFVLLFFVNASLAGVKVVGGLTREMTLNSGEFYEGQIQLVNNEEDSSYVRIFQTDYKFTADGKNYYGSPGTTPRSNAAWLSLTPSRVVLAPHETKSVYYNVHVPQAEDLNGTYWSVIMVEPVGSTFDPNYVAQKGKVSMGLRTVIRYAVQIVTNIGETGESHIRLGENGLIHHDGHLLLRADIENVGDRWLRPSVWVELYNNEGTRIGHYESGQKRIFPYCSVRHHLDLTEVPKGVYTAILIVDNGDDRVFGTYYQLHIE